MLQPTLLRLMILECRLVLVRAGCMVCGFKGNMQEKLQWSLYSTFLFCRNERHKHLSEHSQFSKPKSYTKFVFNHSNATELNVDAASSKCRRLGRVWEEAGNKEVGDDSYEAGKHSSEN